MVVVADFDVRQVADRSIHLEFVQLGLGEAQGSTQTEGRTDSFKG